MSRRTTILLSLVISILLCSSALALAGAGHGTYIPLAFVASPSILLATIPMNQFPLFWTGVGLAPLHWIFLAWTAARRSLFFIALILLQYIGAALFLLVFKEDSSHVRRMFNDEPMLVITTAFLYAAGQTLLWCTFLQVINTVRPARSTTTDPIRD